MTVADAHPDVQALAGEPAPAPRLVGELAVFVLPALLVAVLLSWWYARRSAWIGTWDAEQILWQGQNLLTVVRSGDALLRTSFLGVPTPYTYSPSMHCFSLPLMALASVTAPCFAYNFLVAVMLIANFSSMYAVLRRVGLTVPAATTGAGIFVLGPASLMRSVVHVYLASAFFLPLLFYLLFLERTRGFRLGHWALFGALVAGMYGMHEYMGVLGLSLLAVALACNLGRLGGRRAAAAGAAAAGVFVVMSLPVLWTHVAQVDFDRAHGLRFERSLDESISLSCTPSDFVLPSNQNPLYRRVLAPTLMSEVSESFNYLGVVNLGVIGLLAGWALFRRDLLRALGRRSPMLVALWRELAITGLGGLVVSFGPRWKPDPRFLLPVTLLLWLHLPPFTMLRGWGRFGFVVFFVLTLVTAHVVDFVMRRRRSGWGLACLLLAVAAVDQCPMAGIPTFRVPVPASVRDLAREPGEFFVLNLPLASNTGSLHSGTAQVMRWYHDKPIVSGYSAFVNPLYVDALASSPLRGLDHATLRSAPACDVAELGRWMAKTHIRCVVYEKKTQYYRPDFTESDDRALRTVTLAALDGLVAAGVARPVSEDEDYVVYRVQADP